MQTKTAALLDLRVNGLQMNATDFSEFILHCIATCDTSGHHGTQPKDVAAWQAALVTIGAITADEASLVSGNSNHSSSDFGSLQISERVRIMSHMAILMSEEMYFENAVDALDPEWSMETCKLISQFGPELIGGGSIQSFRTDAVERKFWLARRLEYVYGIGQALDNWKVEQGTLGQANSGPISATNKTKKLWIGLGMAGVVVLGGLAAVAVYGSLSNSKNGYATGGTFTAEAIANLTSEAGRTSGGGSMGVVVWTVLVLSLLGAIAGAVYWWWGRGEHVDKVLVLYAVICFLHIDPRRAQLVVVVVVEGRVEKSLFLGALASSSRAHLVRGNDFVHCTEVAQQVGDHLASQLVQVGQTGDGPQLVASLCPLHFRDQVRVAHVHRLVDQFGILDGFTHQLGHLPMKGVHPLNEEVVHLVRAWCLPIGEESDPIIDD